MRFFVFKICVVTAFESFFSARNVRGQAAITDTLTVVNWNLEWFADGQTHNPAVQVAGVRTLMNSLNADVYALCEIVNADSLESLAASLAGGFSALVSDFGSFATSRQDPDWPEAQKLAFVYRNSKVRVLHSRALLAADPYAYYNFSSGRYPFLVNAEAKGDDGVWRALDFVVLHAKASSDYNSCQRRSWAAYMMKDTLDNRFGGARVMVLGDFNDDLDGTICSGGGASAYEYFVKDSTDANHYLSVTLPLSKAGAYSLEGYSNLIDHVVVTNELRNAYVPGSARWLKTDVLAMIPAYTSTITDHYPIQSKYIMNAATLSVSDAAQAYTEKLHFYPNPATACILFSGSQNIQAVEIFAADGRMISRGNIAHTRGGIDVSHLAPGAYFVRTIATDGSILNTPLTITR